MVKRLKKVCAKMAKWPQGTRILQSRPSRTRFLIIALMMPILLTACGTTKPTFNQSTKRLICPTVIEYSMQFRNQIADELEQYQTKAIIEALKDYKIMRQQSRLCRGQK